VRARAGRGFRFPDLNFKYSVSRHRAARFSATAKTKAFEPFSAGHVRHFTLPSRMAWQYSGIVLAF
jgi:hypothetical protein